MLTTAASVHSLPANLAAQKIPVRLTAWVTYYEPKERTLFVADKSGAVYVKTTVIYPLRRGDLIRIEGVTAKSFRTTVARDPKITVIGHSNGSLAQNRQPLTYPDLMSGRWDCQYVSVRGRVRSAVVDHRDGTVFASLELLLPGGTLQVHVQNTAGLDLNTLLDSQIEVTGIVGGDFNARWELIHSILYAADRSELHILSQPRVRLQQIPLTRIDDIIPTRVVNDQTPRVRTRGLLAFYRPGYSAVVQAEGRSLFVNTRQFTPIPLGSVVDVTGFADDSGYGPTLQDGELFPTGQTGKLQPLPIHFAEAMSGIYADNLIQLRGTVLSQVRSEGAETLYLMVDNHAVSAVLQDPSHTRGLPRVPQGSLVTVSGICRITPTSDWGTPGASPMLFRLDMRNPDDLSVIALPAWWTVTHLAIVVGALFAMSLLIAVWAIVLRRRVAQQTATIARSMQIEKERSRILEQINSNCPLPALLDDIQRTVDAFVPGVRCFYNLDPDREAFSSLGDQSQSDYKLLPFELYHADLTDTRGRHLGMFRVRSTELLQLQDRDGDVLAMGAALVNLAVNQRQMYQELNYTSTHDQLTSLPNRRLSDVTLERAVQAAEAGGHRMGVAYVDVNRFKEVNDQHGHRIGDLYLQQIAHRLAGTVRASDQLARIGGDEFLLIAATLESVEDGLDYKSRLEECFQRPFLLEGVTLSGSASIGIAVYPDHGTDPEDLKRHADIDMYREKRRSHLENTAAQPDTVSDILTATDIRSALQNGHFELHYQPQFSGDRKLRGLEGLIRLNDPVLGMVMPDSFIATAERSDVIHPLGRWALQQAMADGLRWGIDRSTGVRMVVNVSWRQIEHPGFPDEVIADLRASGFPAHCLEIEITERTVARDCAAARRHLERLHGLGVTISIDDFGIEHSCLSTLHALPVDTIKIDRSFIKGLNKNHDTQHIIRAIVQMGHAMRKRIVAEGVETEECLRLLTSLGEMDFQGYLFSRPLPPDQILDQLPTWRVGMSVAGKQPRLGKAPQPDGCP